MKKDHGFVRVAIIPPQPATTTESAWDGTTDQGPSLSDIWKTSSEEGWTTAPEKSSAIGEENTSPDDRLIRFLFAGWLLTILAFFLFVRVEREKLALNGVQYRFEAMARSVDPQTKRVLYFPVYQEVPR